MIRWQRLSLALVCGAFVSALSSMALRALAATTLPAPATRPAFAALSYYDQNCARCHGPDGSFYGNTLGNDLTDAGLVKEIRDMANGPGNAPIQESEIAVETAYHRALIMHTPFVSVTDMTTSHWAGEASPSAKVTLTVGAAKITATISDWNWTADLPANTDPRDVTITAELSGKTVTLKPGEATFSSTTPLPPAKERPGYRAR